MAVWCGDNLSAPWAVLSEILPLWKVQPFYSRGWICWSQAVRIVYGWTVCVHFLSMPGMGIPDSRKQSWRKSLSRVNWPIVFNILSCCFFRSSSFLRKSFSRCVGFSNTDSALSRNSLRHLRTILGLRLFSAAITPSSFSSLSTSRTIFVLNLAVQLLLRYMVFAPFIATIMIPCSLYLRQSVVQFHGSIIDFPKTLIPQLIQIIPCNPFWLY